MAPSSGTTWKELSWYRHDDFVDGPALGCYLTKVFCYRGWRNAWQSATSQEWGGFSPTMEATSSAAEKARKRGTTLTILELPAISLMGKSRDLVMLELCDAPFKETERLAITGNSLLAVGESIRVADPYALRYKAYHASRGAARVPILPYKAFEAFLPGAGCRYEWRPTYHRPPDITHIASLVSRVCVHLNSRN